MENHILISIGRQFGSGGRLIARMLGDRLGVPVYDNELITKAAEESGYSPEFFQRSDEKKHSLLLAGILDGNLFNRNMIGDAELFRIQSEVIQDIASKGPAIFLGRASDYVLRDTSCMSVFISAPDEKRIEVVSEREGISAEEAWAMIERKDKARANYYNFFTQKNWGVASNYDLCIYRTVIPDVDTVDLIIEFAKRKGIL